MQIDTLTVDEYASWDELVSKSDHGTVFHYSWWLEATGFDFQILVCRSEHGLIAGIPLPRKKRFGLTLFHSPHLTPYLGPIFSVPALVRPHRNLGATGRMGEALARAIRGFDSLSYDVGPMTPYLLGFLWAGFQAQLSYTFRFEATSKAKDILERAATGHRGELKKAFSNHIEVEVGGNVEPFLELNRRTFRRQGRGIPFEQDLPRRLWAAARSRGLGDVYLARMPDGSYAAGLLIVHDERSSYQLMAGGDPLLRRSGAGNLLEWRAIQDALNAGRAYDFEGSKIRGVEAHFRHWGANPKPIFTLGKAGSIPGGLARLIVRGMP